MMNIAINNNKCCFIYIYVRITSSLWALELTQRIIKLDFAKNLQKFWKDSRRVPSERTVTSLLWMRRRLKVCLQRPHLLLNVQFNEWRASDPARESCECHVCSTDEKLWVTPQIAHIIRAAQLHGRPFPSLQRVESSRSCSSLDDCVSSSLKLTHEQAAVGGSVDGDPAGRGESLPDQELGRTLEVIETVLLVPEGAGWNQESFFKAFCR